MLDIFVYLFSATFNICSSVFYLKCQFIIILVPTTTFILAVTSRNIALFHFLKIKPFLITLMAETRRHYRGHRKFLRTIFVFVKTVLKLSATFRQFLSTLIKKNCQQLLDIFFSRGDAQY